MSASIGGSDYWVVKLLPDSSNNLSEISQQKVCNIFPNPNDGQFIIDAPNINRVEIFDVSGEKLKTVSFHKSNNSRKINLKPFSRGVYFVKFYFGNSVTTQKLIIQ